LSWSSTTRNRPSATRTDCPICAQTWSTERRARTTLAVESSPAPNGTSGARKRSPDGGRADPSFLRGEQPALGLLLTD